MESFLGQILRDNFSNFVIYADRVFRYKSEKQSRTNVLARPNIFRLNNSRRCYSRPTRSDTDRFTIPLESRLSLSTSKRRGNESIRKRKGREKERKKSREDNDLYARCFSLFAFKRETVTKKTKYVRTITVQHGGIHLSSRKQLIPCTKHSYS